MNLKLENKVVLLTGGTGGIGTEIVVDFLKENSIVVCLYRNEKKILSLKENLIKRGVDIKNLHGLTCNLLDFDNLKEVAKLAFEKLGRIDVLVNCAGKSHEYPFGLLDQSHIDEQIQINLTSPLYLTQAVLPFMYKNKGGSIINISSVSSTKKGRGISVYASAKAGLETFTRILALEVGRKNIRVNCIKPGVVETSMTGPLIERLGKEIKQTTSLSRFGKSPEISKMVLFLASSEASSYLTGECINIDGGLY
jgi:3-oxoacyl-[acyl-carrier protein] reductase